MKHQNQMLLSIGFLGFGEAGYGIAKGLKASGLKQIFVFDKFQNVSPHKQLIRSRIQDADVIMVSKVKKLAASSELIFSTVTVSRAMEIAEEIAEFLNPGHIYVDMNSTSPQTQKKISKIINKSGAAFIDAALMGAIAFFGHQIPVLAAGESAAVFQRKLSSYGMDIRCIKGEPGSASAVKMLRSVYMKGIEALLLETMTAAQRYRISELVVESIAQSMETKPFMETVNMLITTNAIHSERRSKEMEEVAATLTEKKIDPVMTEATRRVLQWSASLNLKDHYKGKAPDKYKTVLATIDQKIK